MKKLIFAVFLLIGIGSQAQRMLVLPDTPTFANQNRGVWVFRIADNLPYYSNGSRWVANTGGLGPSTISDSLTAYNSRVVTSYNGIRGPVKGVDSLWFTASGTIMHWRWNGLLYSQAIVGGGGAGTWGTITGTLSDQSDLQAALNLKLSLADSASMLDPYLRKIDSTGKWVTSARRRADSVFIIVGGGEVFVFKDSIGAGSLTDTTSLSNRINLKVDSVTFENDSLFYYVNGSRNFVLETGAGLSDGDSSLAIWNAINLKVSRSEWLDSLTAHNNKIDTKQDALVSGTNIKTVNGNTLLGSGDLVISVGEANTGSNVGTGAEVFKQKTGVDLEHRTIIGTDGITATQNTNDITISGNADSSAARVRKGTYAQRIAFVAAEGDIWVQTDRLRGMWFYDNAGWQFQGIPLKYLFYDQYSIGSGASTTPAAGYNSYHTTTSSGSVSGSLEQRYGSDYWYKLTSTGGDIFYTTQISAGAVDAKYVDSAIYYYETTIEFSHLSDATDNFYFSLGYDNSISSSGDRIVFQYNHATNGGEWETRTVAATTGTWTTKDTNVPFVAGTPVKFAYEVDGYARTIYFYINDVLVTTHASPDNVPFPNATTLATSISAMAFNLKRTAGTAARSFSNNYIFGYKPKSIK